ncbi:hypothetical protein [Pandoraea soli]
MLPPIDTTAASNLAQSYLALAAGGRIQNAIQDARAGLADLNRMQNATLSHLDYLIAQAKAGALKRAASADAPQGCPHSTSLQHDLTRCRACSDVSASDNT